MTKRTALLGLLLSVVGLAQAPATTFDVVLRHGTILDGTGGARYDADLGVRDGHIVAIGDLAKATAAVDLDARGLFVAPGFINIHAHPSPDALPTAVNMLLQGVTTEITNPDGGGPVDLAEQMSRFEKAGLAINIGGFIGFNSIWQAVVGDSDRRPGPAEIDRMREMITAGLAQGAWGVSAGLDYKPGYFAQTEEVIKVVDAARPWRTNFTNHDRITPESNYSSRVGITETVAIGQKSGLVPIVTHMKVQGIEQGTAAAVLATMAKATKDGHYTAADAYPYLAGQSGLGALIVPGWAQEGGREAMLKRFADPATRARIVAESEQAMSARFGGPQGVYLPRTQQELTEVMKEMNAGAGETVLRIIEKGDPGAILRFGIEADLVKILQDPVTSMACDCGATTATRVHPRFYGSFPRVLGRYVREQKIMSWEEAIRKMSGLPASTIGMVDRGFIAVGMAADLTAFDPQTVIDHATYENPTAPPEGIRYVLVNGAIAVRDGKATGAQGGHAQIRTAHMPSRAMVTATERRVKAPGIDVSQKPKARAATGTLRMEDPNAKATIRADQFGVMQVAPGWASVTGIATVSSGESEAFTLIVDFEPLLPRDPQQGQERQWPVAIYTSARRTVTLPIAPVNIRGAR
ncbi:MAG: amidohydrolase family protein [Vicinamibacterales bacterium]